jgi:hypothetical protein
MTRAKSLLALGDVAAARLLLERAANAQDAPAAFLLAQTGCARSAKHHTRPRDGARLEPQGRQLWLGGRATASHSTSELALESTRTVEVDEFVDARTSIRAI